MVGHMSRISLMAIALLPAVATAASARGSTPPQKTAWQTAIADSFNVQHTTTGDLNSDGITETISCYLEEKSSGGSDSGVVIFQNRGSLESPVFHVVLKDSVCKQLKVKGSKLGILSLKGASKEKIIWTYGKEIVFSSDVRHPLNPETLKITSSDQGYATENERSVLDGKLDTSWSEKTAGTGIGQTITIRFSSPQEIGYLGIFAGHGGGKREFYDHNRVHRMSILTQTEADLGDDDAEIDFSDFGIDIGGDRIEAVIQDKGALTYIPVGKKNVLQIEFRIDSVYLGKKRDETHIAEIEIIPSVGKNSLSAKPLPLAKRPGKSNVSPRKESAPSQKVNATGQDRKERIDGLLDALDSTGRSVVSTDDL
jgi:hypothetical protein